MSNTITQIGVNALHNAQTGGVLIDIASFKASANTNIVKPDPSTTQLKGIVVYEGTVSNIEVYDGAVYVSCFFDTNFPEEGSITITEIGLFLKTGEMFAHCIPDVPIEKKPYFALAHTFRIQIETALEPVINISPTNITSTPYTSKVEQLQSPATFVQNAICVGDLLTNTDGSNSAGLAIKSRGNNAFWSFANHDIIYHGTVLNPTPKSFQVDNNKVKVFEKEILLANVTTGAGAGESRKVQVIDGTLFVYNGTNFSSLDGTSYIALHRNTINNKTSNQAFVNAEPLIEEELTKGVNLIRENGESLPVDLKLGDLWDEAEKLKQEIDNLGTELDNYNIDDLKARLEQLENMLTGFDPDGEASLQNLIAALKKQLEDYIVSNDAQIGNINNTIGSLSEIPADIRGTNICNTFVNVFNLIGGNNQVISMGLAYTMKNGIDQFENSILTIPIPTGFTKNDVACVVVGGVQYYAFNAETPDIDVGWPIPIPFKGNSIGEGNLFRKLGQNQTGTKAREVSEIVIDSNNKGVFYIMFSLK